MDVSLCSTLASLKITLPGVATTNFSQENSFKNTYGTFVRYMELSFQLVPVHCSPFHR